MVKKDIYEHLADIYWDASSKKKKNKSAKPHPKIFKNLFFLSVAVIIFLSAILMHVLSTNIDQRTFAKLRYGKPASSELALVLQPAIVKINFDFDTAKEEIYSVNLNGLDVHKFRTVAFSARKADYQDNIILKVEVTDASRKKSQVYINDMPAYRWQDYKIGFAEFRGIGDWSGILNIAFIVQEKNIKQKRGIVYLDNIRFSR